MFLAVVLKSNRVDSSRTGGNRLVGGWKMIDELFAGWHGIIGIIGIFGTNDDPRKFHVLS